MSTTLSTPTPLAELKAKQQQIWSSGDYNKIAAITVPVAESLVAHTGIRPGATVLDVATGTGHAALAAARQSAVVTGVDYVPRLIDIAKLRAAAEDLPIDFRVADAEDLPFDDDGFDDVLSVIGVMFTADHSRAAEELVRVCRPGGRIALANWTASGFVGRLLRTVGAHVPPPPVAQSPTRWGTEDAIRDLFAGHSVDISFVTESVTQRFASPEVFADFFLSYYGPTFTASERLSEDGRQSLRDDMVALAREFNQTTNGTFVGDWEYLVAIVTTR